MSARSANPARPVADAQRADDAGLAEAPIHVNPGLGQHGRDDVGGCGVSSNPSSGCACRSWRRATSLSRSVCGDLEIGRHGVVIPHGLCHACLRQTPAPMTRKPPMSLTPHAFWQGLDAPWHA